jgi:hypothetical protein
MSLNSTDEIFFFFQLNDSHIKLPLIYYQEEQYSSKSSNSKVKGIKRSKKSSDFHRNLSFFSMDLNI